MKRIVTAILAHVDAGKTTLSESMLYLSGNLKKLGRVDHKNAFLDNYRLERERGITIFSKQAVLYMGDSQFTLLDTPGHVDFSTETERTLQVLDYAVLVISGTDGVQSHTETLWRLLEQYNIPVFIFINKMDLNTADKNAVLSQLKQRLSDGCIDFSPDRNQDEFFEEAALCNESMMEKFLSGGTLSDDDLRFSIIHRQIFPCFFGSALKLDGVEEFLRGIDKYTVTPTYPKDFGAKVYKISRDSQGIRLTWMKITGGELSVKDRLKNSSDSISTWEEKADQLRIYSGEKYKMVDCVPAGCVCAVTGLSLTQPGDALGLEPKSLEPVLEPVLTYQIILPDGCDVSAALRQLRQLEEEDPQLHIVWNEQLQQIHIQLMGEIQLEILKSLIWERFNLDVSFGKGSIVYKETISAPVEGIGHFEPLRHYAEVHLLLEPLEAGSGLKFTTACSEDILDKNWQRLILTHLEEKEHLGVLTGSPITDMRITILTGRSHAKHTEGGDFRQATYRAVRQGLMKAQSVLLEPWYKFRLELPQEFVGRAMSDIPMLNGSFDTQQMDGQYSVLTGSAPVASIRDYRMDVIAYTKGRGNLSLSFDGYKPCHNTDEVIANADYNPESDIENTPDSVFCSHGAGYNVKWDDVENHMHLESAFKPQKSDVISDNSQKSATIRRISAAYTNSFELDKELKRIFERTYGTITPRDFRSSTSVGYNKPREVLRQLEPASDYLLVDGYNIIFSWDDLNAVAKESLDAARQLLMDMLCNYQAYKHCEVILVFDAYRVPGKIGTSENYNNIHIVYTKQAETADMFIEKVAYEINGKKNVRVATSDGLEQIIILAHGAHRISASAFRDEMDCVLKQISEAIHRQNNR